MQQKTITLHERDGAEIKVKIICNFDSGTIIKSKETVFLLELGGNKKLNHTRFCGYVRTKDIRFFREKFGYENKGTINPINYNTF